MRHLLSALLALLLAAVVWGLTAIGFSTLLIAGPGADGVGRTPEVGYAILLLSGLAYAALVVPRLSPVGPLLAGIAFLAVTSWVLLSPTSTAGLLPEGLLERGYDLLLPARGYAILLAVPMIATALSPRRWRPAGSAPAGPTQAGGPGHPYGAIGAATGSPVGPPGGYPPLPTSSAAWSGPRPDAAAATPDDEQTRVLAGRPGVGHDDEATRVIHPPATGHGDDEQTRVLRPAGADVDEDTRVLHPPTDGVDPDERTRVLHRPSPVVAGPPPVVAGPPPVVAGPPPVVAGPDDDGPTRVIHPPPPAGSAAPRTDRDDDGVSRAASAGR